MRLDNLFLFNFKNYNNCSFSFSPRLNFIYGNNGNGKTNILEAISFLCYTKSFLQNAETECIKRGEKSFKVDGSFKNEFDSGLNVNIGYFPDDTGKVFHINGEKISRLNGGLGLFPLVTLSPYDLKLTTGVPLERRRNFDLLISQTSRIYLEDIRNLSRILRQKNTLLKDNLITKRYSYNDLRQMISVWNEELVNVSVKVIVRRMDFMDNFLPLLT